MENSEEHRKIIKTEKKTGEIITPRSFYFQRNQGCICFEQSVITKKEGKGKRRKIWIYLVVKRQEIFRLREKNVRIVDASNFSDAT